MKEAIMGSAHLEPEASKTRPILNERDYQNAKALVAKHINVKHTDRMSARIEALMQEVADYERRFLEGEEEDAARLVEYAYTEALEETEVPQRRWSDSSDD